MVSHIILKILIMSRNSDFGRVFKINGYITVYFKYTHSRYPPPISTQLPTTVTLRLLNRFQSPWYLGYLARAETSENSIYNPIFYILPTYQVPNVKRILEMGWNEIAQKCVYLK